MSLLYFLKMLRPMKLLPVILLLSVASANAQSFAGRRKMDEKYGFRDVRFESDSTSISGLKHAFDQRGERYYERPTDNLHIGEAELKAIYYVFVNGKLSEVDLMIEGATNTNAVYAALKEEYGPVYTIPYSGGQMGWTSGTEQILLGTGGTQQQVIRFLSRKMIKEARDVKKASAKAASSDL